MKEQVYATWRSYQIVTNMGVYVGVLKYVTPTEVLYGGWSPLSSPSPQDKSSYRVLTKDAEVVVGGDPYVGIGARPALYH